MTRLHGDFFFGQILELDERLRRPAAVAERKVYIFDPALYMTSVSGLLSSGLAGLISTIVTVVYYRCSIS